MGGYSLGQADNVRRIMGKKKVDKMAYEREKFINGWEDPKGLHSIPGAVKLGVPRETAEKVFAEMESFAQYAFNKSHATAYAMVTYQTAYLKCYYEVEFLTAIINNRITKADEIKTYVTYARSENIEVLPPNINKSQTYFSVENGNIRYGLSGLKGVGVSAISTILKEREKGEFKDLYDFISRIMHVQPSLINKKSMESLIFSGALDCFGLYRSQLNAMYDTIIEKVDKDMERQKTGQFSLFENFEQNLGKVDEVIPAGNAFFDVFNHLFTQFRIFQALDQLVRAAVVNPRRQDNAEHRAAGDVRILVEGDADTFAFSLLQEFYYLLKEIPVLAAAYFKVGEMNFYAGLTADFDDFLHGIDNRVGFAALMDDEYSVVFRNDLTKLDDFLRLAVCAGHVNQACR